MQTYEKVLAEIEVGLISGRWSLGDRLASERALAEEFGVSRASVREALRVLEAMGIITRATGSGPESGATVVDQPAAGLGSAIRLHVAAGTVEVRDVVEMRLLLEGWAAQSVAMRCATELLAESKTGELLEEHGPQESCLARAQEILDKMESPDITPQEFQTLDTDFHVELVRLGGNSLFEATMLGLRKAIAHYVAAGVDRIDNWDELEADLRAEHREILQALKAGDALAATKVVEAHIEGFYRRALG